VISRDRSQPVSNALVNADTGYLILDAGCWMLDADAAGIFGERFGFWAFFNDKKDF
jgi:hypothetical protein